jgi:amino acid transporter
MAQLKRESLGFLGLVFLSIAAIFPGSIYIVSSTTSLTYAGITAPLTFIIGTLMMLTNVVAVYIFSTKIASAGGFYKFVESAFGKSPISSTTGLIQFLGQLCPVIISATVFGWLIPVTASSLFNVTLPYYIPFLASLAVIIFVFVVSYLGIHLSRDFAVASGIVQIIAILAVSLYVIFKSPYNTIQVFNIKLSPSGLSGFFLGTIVGPYTAYIGYSSVVHFGEEAKLPKETIKKAILVSLISLAVFETLVMYAITIGVPPSDLSNLASSFAPALVVTSKYLGIYIALAVLIIALFGQITSPLVFGNAAERVLFSLSRDGILPKFLYKVHEKYGSPSNASIVVFLVALSASLITQVIMVYYYGVLQGFFYTVVFWALIMTVMNLGYHAIVNQSLAFLTKKIKRFIYIKTFNSSNYWHHTFYNCIILFLLRYWITTYLHHTIYHNMGNSFNNILYLHI